MSEIRQIIRNHLVEEFNLEMPPDDASPLVQQGILDSLGIFMLIEFFKDAFGVRINPDDVSFENFETNKRDGETYTQRAFIGIPGVKNIAMRNA